MEFVTTDSTNKMDEARKLSIQQDGMEVKRTTCGTWVENLSRKLENNLSLRDMKKKVKAQIKPCLEKGLAEETNTRDTHADFIHQVHDAIKRWSLVGFFTISRCTNQSWMG
jgi:hypothetical protein